MATKLTLSITDKELIEEAKKYAKANNKSLSKMIESYLESIVPKRKNKINPENFTPRVKALMGIIKTERKIDYKKERAEKQDKKYKKYMNG